MSKDDRSREVLEMADSNEIGPGHAFETFITMENLLDKLKLLNYDKEFGKTLLVKPIHRHYFATQTNPGEQFFVFTSLAAWLIRLTGRPFEQPQEYDDPNSTISSILDVVRQLGTQIDFSPSKLKQGCGEQVVFVLNLLVDAALQASKFSYQKPKPPPELDDDEGQVEDESELILEKVEEEMAGAYSDEEEENLIHVDDLQNLSFGRKDSMENQKPEEILESNIDRENWKLELERVLPQLKVTIKSDPRDWRSHLEQMQQHRAGIEEALTNTKVQLDKLHSDISRTLEKISSREKFLNSQMEPLLAQYRSLQDQLSRLNEQYQEVSGGVAERSRVLSSVTEELESVKQEMEERGSSMTDGKPVVNIKKAIARIKGEITTMDVRLGVLENSLLQARLRDKTQLQQDMSTYTQISF